MSTNTTDHIIIPVSHIGMLLSDEVIYQTRCFLRHGRFDPRKHCPSLEIEAERKPQSITEQSSLWPYKGKC
jgi:hypothetical protein